MFYDTLRYFLVTAEELNMTRAAEKLHFTQQALSLHISKLESEYQTRFFERTKKGLALTPQGRRFREFATAALHMEQETAGAIRDIGCARSGTIRIGTTMTRAVTLLPEPTSRFSLKHPLVKIDIRIVSSLQNELEGALLRRELDLIVVPVVQKVPATIEVKELLKSYACLSVPREFIETIIHPGETAAAFALLPLSEQKQRILTAQLFDRIPIVYAARFIPHRAQQFLKLFTHGNPAVIDLASYENLFGSAFCGHAAVFTQNTLFQQVFAPDGAPNQFVYPIDVPESPFAIAVYYQKDSINPIAGAFINELLDFAAKHRAPPPQEFFARLD